MALNPRQQRLVLVMLVVVGLAAAYQQLLWSPQQQQIAAINARADTLDSLNQLAKADMAKGNTSRLRFEADEFGRQLTTMRRLVPTATEVPGLLDAVSMAAREADLDVSEFSPDGVVPGNGFDVYKFKMGVTGPYSRIAQFLANVGSLERIVQPINLSLTPTARKTDTKPGKNEALIDAHFDIQTYVAHATPSASGGK